MKVLTIKDPFAQLIINGYKEYEFRSWKTTYRGKLLIHTSKQFEKSRLDDFKNYNLEYKPGFIIGEVELTDCILVDGNFQNELRKKNKILYKSNNVGNYAWKVDNPIIYEKPIEIKGHLGLWNYDNN